MRKYNFGVLFVVAFKICASNLLVSSIYLAKGFVIPLSLCSLTFLGKASRSWAGIGKKL